MENTEFAQRIVELNRTATENTWHAMTLWQDQTERITRAVLENSHNMAEEGQRVVEEWVKEYKRGRTAARKTMENNYQQIQDLFNWGPRKQSKNGRAKA
jgi:hypothetical protein